MGGGGVAARLLDLGGVQRTAATHVLTALTGEDPQDSGPSLL